MQIFINAVLISLSLANTIGLLYIARVDKEVVKAVSNFDIRLKVVESILTNKGITSVEEAEEITKIIEADRDAYVKRHNTENK